MRPLFPSTAPPSILASGLCPLVACCKERNPPHLYCMPTGQFPWHSLWLHKFRPLQVEKLFGVYAGIIGQRLKSHFLVRFNACFFPKQFTVGFSLRKKRLAAICSGRVSGDCPPCVRLVSALDRFVSAVAAPPSLVRLASALCLPALCPPCVGFGRASKRCVSHVALCVRHLSAPCLFFALSLPARFSLFIRCLSVFGWVYGLALAGPLSVLRPLFGFCAFVCPVFVAGPLPAVRLVTFSRQCSCLP